MRMLKKSLAICLAAILAMTAMFGCIVSAAVIEGGTVVAGDVEIKSDATSVTVPITVTAPASTAEATYNFDLVRVKVTSNIGKLTGVELIDCSKDEDGVTNLVKDVNMEEDVNTDVGIIIIETQSMNFPFTFATVNATFEITAEDFAYGKEYAVDVLGITDIEGADYNENGYSFTYDDGVITVACAHIAGDPVVENNVDATCDKAGSYDSVVYCSVCNEEMTRETVTVEATGDHTAGEPVVENNVDPTCAEAGSYDSVVYCSVCNAEISRETVEVPATGEHNYVDGKCDVCGAEDPDANPEDAIAALISGIAISNVASTQNVVGTSSYTAAATKAVALAVDKIGGVITGMGVAMSYDGTDIKTSDSVYVNNIPVDTSTWNYLLSKGAPLNVYAEYKGMNFAQMDQEVVFAAYVTYTKGGVSSTVYGVEAASVFSEYLADATDADSVALKSSYDLVQSATTTDVVESSVVASDNGPTFKISYDLKTAYLRGTAVYTAAQTKAIANAIKAEGGVITGMGVMMSYDGTDVKTSDTVYVSNIAVNTSVWNGLVSSGYPLTVYAEYKGMNVAQFATDLEFIPYVYYTDADGAAQTMFIGDIHEGRFIDAIADETDALGVAYTELYNSFNG